MALGNNSVRSAAQALVDYAIACDLIGEADRIWAYNTVLDCVGAQGPAPEGAWVRRQGAAVDTTNFDLEVTLGLLAEAAVESGAAEDTVSSRDRVSCRIMGTLMPKPTQIVDEFERRSRAGNIKDATSWFYSLCCNAYYVRRAAIARNIEWTAKSTWGDLQITINLSKPEKDPREIAAAGAAKATSEKYPACQLCIENEGYAGRSAASAGGAHPARQNLRIVPITLGGERWELQYSPYAYFSEHCIAMSERHRPMHIDRACLTCLVDFVDTMPHYFIGANADLPIVGGSILSHDHFQGGAHEFPMMRAEVASEFSIPGFEGVSGAVLRWPLSVLRLCATRRSELLDACMHVIDAWRTWSDEEAGVLAESEDGTPHNTVTPIIRRVSSSGTPGGNQYEAYLALRCNITSSEHPLGVFHPHAEYHHIKRENIGLIEVMGLAILPARLAVELKAVSEYLLADNLDALERDSLCQHHAAWARELYARRKDELTPESVQAILREEVGAVFGHVLENTGVFKWDEAGRAAQQRFIDAL